MDDNFWHDLGFAVVAGVLFFAALLRLLVKRVTDVTNGQSSVKRGKSNPLKSRIAHVARFIAKLPWPG